MKILVVGLGRTGLAVARFLTKARAVVTVTGVGTGFTDYPKRAVVKAASENADQFLSVAIVERLGEPTDLQGGEVSGVDYEYVLSSLAEKTGGLHLTSLSAMGVGHKLRALAAHLRSQYRLSYETFADLDERKIEVQVARPEIKIRIVSPPGGGR